MIKYVAKLNAMTGRTHYHCPPVVEAVCEVAFASSSWDAAVPGQFYARVRNDFPKKRELKLLQAQLNIDVAQGASSAGVVPCETRMQFLSESEDRLIQLGQDVLVVNHLKPYTRFETWEQDLHTAVEIYRELAEPKALQSLTVRYLNRIDLPGPIVPLENYLTVYPHIPASFENHGPFMVRFQLAADEGHLLVLTFASAPSEDPNRPSFVLDLVDRCLDLTFENLTTQLRRGHDLLVATFEESCTDVLKATFEPEVEA